MENSLRFEIFGHIGQNKYCTLHEHSWTFYKGGEGGVEFSKFSKKGWFRFFPEKGRDW